MRTRILAGGALALVAAIGATRWVRDRGAVDFNRDIRPILNTRCIACHGGVRQLGKVSLLFREDALKPAKSGKIPIVPGDPDGSEVIRRITHGDPHDRMPKGHDPLPPREIALIRRWIRQGAPWEPHWAYVKPLAPPLPTVSRPAWPHSDLDRFVLAKLDAERLAPSAPAPCAVLARRVSLDLVGVPPTLERTEQLCADRDSTAYDRYVDELLASPRFGERWAAMWLDLARYADSQGYEKDPARSIWRYRDWVIDALNRDMPFDRFTIAQLAGDLLPNATDDDRIATAFHRNTMTNDEGGTDDEEHRSAAVIDRVNTTFVVWQGTSMACAPCHTHPYDPIRHTDYYRAFAYFNNTADWDQTNDRPVHVTVPPAKAREGEALLGTIRALEARAESLTATPHVAAARKAWEGTLMVPAVAGKLKDTWQNEVLRIARTPDSARDGEQKMRLDWVYAEVSDDPALAAIRKARDQAWAQLGKLDPTLTPVMQELPPAQRRTTHVYERGNFLVRGEVVAPGVPAAIGPRAAGLPANRLGLAQWLVHPDNPLTGRVIVNRFWEQLFGIGIVETTEDFGTQGAPPSNQALLDFLAVRFTTTGQWSVKGLLRDIVRSSTYRQSSAATPALLERDPQDRLLARGPRHRLTAEQVRDEALAVSGLLSDKMLGPSVMPPQPDGVWQRPYSGEVWKVATGDDRYRRAVYTLWKRTAPYPSMLAFDSPSREFCVSRRVRTNTPLQALVTLNDPAFVEAAAALGARMAEAGPVDAALTRGYRLALLRAPDAPALAVLRALYEEALARYRAHPADGESLGGPGATPERAAYAVVANALLNLDAFVSKE